MWLILIHLKEEGMFGAHLVVSTYSLSISVSSYVGGLYNLCLACEMDIKTFQATFSNTFSSAETNLTQMSSLVWATVPDGALN